MTVDAAGVPTDVKVITPTTNLIAREVVQAVAQYRFRPATLNSVPTAVPLVLKLTVRPSMN
jgi:hypothetical protein